MIISIKRILFPTDFSEPAKEAQLYAMALAEKFGAELHLLHVIPPLIPYPDAAFPYALPLSETELQIGAANQRLAKEVDSKILTKFTAKPKRSAQKKVVVV